MFRPAVLAAAPIAATAAPAASAATPIAAVVAAALVASAAGAEAATVERSEAAGVHSLIVVGPVGALIVLPRVLRFNAHRLVEHLPHAVGVRVFERHHAD